MERTERECQNEFVMKVGLLAAELGYLHAEMHFKGWEKSEWCLDMNDVMRLASAVAHKHRLQ